MEANTPVPRTAPTRTFRSRTSPIMEMRKKLPYTQGLPIHWKPPVFSYIILFSQRSLNHMAAKGKTNANRLSEKCAAPKSAIAPMGVKLNGWGNNRLKAATAMMRTRIPNRRFIFSDMTNIRLEMLDDRFKTTDTSTPHKVRNSPAFYTLFPLIASAMLKSMARWANGAEYLFSVSMAALIWSLSSPATAVLSSAAKV